MPTWSSVRFPAFTAKSTKYTTVITPGVLNLFYFKAHLFTHVVVQGPLKHESLIIMKLLWLILFVVLF